MACATDPSGRVGTQCRTGMVQLANYVKREFGSGDLGCFNPRSVAGGVPSLHADGRAFDAAYNAFSVPSREAGDRLFHWLIDNADTLGLQETLWRGYLWSCRNRHLGIRGPGIQQGPHENHVHFGVGYFTADNFQESWLTGATPDPGDDDLPYSETQLRDIVHDAVLLSLRGDPETQDALYDIIRAANRDGLEGKERTEEQNASIGNVQTALNSEEGQEAIRRAVTGT